jgi:hypothetical protein
MQALKRFLKKYGSHLLYRNSIKNRAFTKLNAKVSHATGQPLSTASGDIFTYHGEDGILLFILSHLPSVAPTFVDIGSGDCIKSNCAMLSVHRNWAGVFIDSNNQQLDIGRKFYQRLNKKNLEFLNCYITPANVNQIIGRLKNPESEIGLLSIDIDGNDYWIWQAIDIFKPAIVVIEAKVEFGKRNIVVPYSEKNHHSVDQMYNGASVEALRNLGLQKGYTLIGANIYGYNLFFVPSHLVKHPLQAATTESVLQFPATQRSFYDESFFQKNQFITATK